MSEVPLWLPLFFAFRPHADRVGALLPKDPTVKTRIWLRQSRPESDFGSQAHALKIIEVGHIRSSGGLPPPTPTAVWILLWNLGLAVMNSPWA